MARLLLPLALLSALCVAPSAHAHDADILFVQASRASLDAQTVDEVVTLTASSLVRLAPIDADGDGALSQSDLEARADAVRAGVWSQMPLLAAGAPCLLGDTEALLRERYVELRGRFACPPGALTQTFRVLSVLPDNYKVVLGSAVDGEQNQRFATQLLQTLPLSATPAEGEGRSGATDLGGWISLGVFHIFTGFDHIVFLVALLLVGGSLKRLLLLVTSFTLAHSVTLGLTALGWVPLDELRTRWVEAAIALSIIWVAAENLILKTHRHRALLTLLFGLIHGFGFASVLQSYGLGERAGLSLLGFNLGVELGQAAIVLALYPLVRLLERREALRVRTVRVVSGAILGAGLFWLVERIAA